MPSTGGCCVFSSVPVKHSTASLTVNTSNSVQAKSDCFHSICFKSSFWGFFPKKDFKFQKPTFIFQAGYFMTLLTGTSTAAWLTVIPTPFSACPKQPSSCPSLPNTLNSFSIASHYATRVPLQAQTSHPVASHILYVTNMCVPTTLSTWCHQAFWFYPLKFFSNTLAPYNVPLRLLQKSNSQHQMIYLVLVSYLDKMKQCYQN